MICRYMVLKRRVHYQMTGKYHGEGRRVGTVYILTLYMTYQVVDNRVHLMRRNIMTYIRECVTLYSRTRIIREILTSRCGHVSNIRNDYIY